jgi:hypothetical protein
MGEFADSAAASDQENAFGKVRIESNSPYSDKLLCAAAVAIEMAAITTALVLGLRWIN